MVSCCNLKNVSYTEVWPAILSMASIMPCHTSSCTMHLDSLLTNRFSLKLLFHVTFALLAESDVCGVLHGYVAWFFRTRLCYNEIAAGDFWPIT